MIYGVNVQLEEMDGTLLGPREPARNKSRERYRNIRSIFFSFQNNNIQNNL
jgi:hypothetical protein